MLRRCPGCKIEKDVSEFKVEKSRPSGFAFRCKPCMREYNYLRQKKRNENLTPEQLEKKRVYFRAWSKNCYRTNPKMKIQLREYRIKNQKKIIKSHNEYCKRKRREDPIFTLKHNLRTRISYIFRFTGANKDQSSSNILGAPVELVKKHIERQFKKGMTWENYGITGWHIDHIMPLSSAKTEEELKTLCHYTNLQPLWYLENIEKANKIVEHQMKIAI